MATIDLQIYDATDTDPVTLLSFSGIGPGPSTAQEIHVWNQKGSTGGDTVRNFRIGVLARRRGEPVFLAAGRPFLDERWLQVRRIGSTPSAWTPLGAGAALSMPDLPFNTFEPLEVRVNAPLTALDDDVEFRLQFFNHAAIPAGWGLSEVAGDGVLSGVGDGAASALFIAANVTESGTPAATVEVPYLAGVDAGEPYGIAAQTIAVSNADGAAATLASGQAYWCLLTVGADGVTQTKGVKAVSASTVKPALPAGRQPLAYVLRQFDGIINTADIEQAWVQGRFKLTAAALLASLGPGEALVDNSLVLFTHSQPIALTASATNRIWMTRSGALAKTTSAAPATVRDLLLYEVVTDGSGVTSVVDRRPFIGPRAARLAMRFGATLAVSNVSTVEVAADARDLLLDPERPLALALDGAGATSGSTRVDVKYSVAGASYVSIFPDTGSMPSIAYNAADPVVARACRPTVCRIPAGARLQSVVSAVPGTAPTGATVVVLGWTR